MTNMLSLLLQVVSGGLLGVGTIDKSTVGQFAMPAIQPFELPYMLEVSKDVLSSAAVAAASEGSQGSILGRGKSASIAIIVILSVLGAALLASLAYLAVRLVKAPKARAARCVTTPFDDGVGRRQGAAGGPPGVGIQIPGLSPLEQQTMRHGPTGGI